MLCMTVYALLGAVVLHGAYAAETETYGSPFRNAKVSCPTISQTHMSLLDVVGPDVPANVGPAWGLGTGPGHFEPSPLIVRPA